MNKKNLLNRYYGNGLVDPEVQLESKERDISSDGFCVESPVKKHYFPRYSEKYSINSPKIGSQPESNFLTSHKSPKSRSFLRHTTYLAKGQSFLDFQKSQLSTSRVSEKQNKPSDKDHFRLTSSYSAVSEYNSRNNLKTYGNDKYDKLATKVHGTANCIEELRKYKQGSLKAEKSPKAETMETTAFKDQKIHHDLNFKKKYSNHEFYTPKPESSYGMISQKLKRIYSPQVEPFKVISPSFKKAQELVTIKDFIIDNKLGGGKFGIVSRAVHIKTKSIYALKKIPKSIIKENMMTDQFILEVKLQTFLKHQNILQIYGVFDDKDHLYLILEYMPDGTLYSLLKKRKTLSEKETAPKIKQIAKAIVFMHEKGIVHRDIKPQNIVLSGNVCKLCDFGWATICTDRRKTYCGTFDYAAPEILQGDQYDMTVDLWCLGVLTYELMVGKAPFYHISRKQTISNILNVETKKINYPSTISSSARSFIDSLLRKKADQRLRFEQILQHPFLANANDEQ